MNRSHEKLWPTIQTLKGLILAQDSETWEALPEWSSAHKVKYIGRSDYKQKTIENKRLVTITHQLWSIDISSDEFRKDGRWNDEKLDIYAQGSSYVVIPVEAERLEQESYAETSEKGIAIAEGLAENEGVPYALVAPRRLAEREENELKGWLEKRTERDSFVVSGPDYKKSMETAFNKLQGKRF